MKTTKTTVIKIRGLRFMDKKEDYEYLIRVEDFPSLKGATRQHAIKQLKNDVITKEEGYKLRKLKYDNMKLPKILKDKIEIEEIFNNEGSIE
jgi:hypothetical protein